MIPNLKIYISLKTLFCLLDVLIWTFLLPWSISIRDDDNDNDDDGEKLGQSRFSKRVSDPPSALATNALVQLLHSFSSLSTSKSTHRKIKSINTFDNHQ